MTADDTDPFDDGIQAAVEFLYNAGIPHKIVQSEDQYAKLNRDPEQQGKFLTVYPMSEVQMMAVIKQFDILLSTIGPASDQAILVLDQSGKFKSPPGDKAVGRCGRIFARYGSLTSRWILAQETLRGDPEYTPLKNWGYVLDSRSSYKPTWIRDPWTQPHGTAGVFDGWYHHHHSDTFLKADFKNVGKTYDTKLFRWV